MTAEPLAYTVDEAAALLKVHPVTLRRWTRAGKLPVSRPNGGTMRYRHADLVALIDGSLQYEGGPQPARRPKPVRSVRGMPDWYDPDAIHPITGRPNREVS